MTHAEIEQFICFAIENNFPILITGKPGGGKTDGFFAGFKLWLDTYNKPGSTDVWMPVISDPTDFKGLPMGKEVNGITIADFIPFAQLQKAITATEKYAILIDDLGQAPLTVQAAIMQVILAREIGGKKISPHVTFIACTNRKEDKAAVSGLIEPLKSRFASIVELEVSTDNWVKWALNNNMPTELIAFIRFRPALLDNFKPTKNMTNSPSPRTVANVGKQINAGIPKGLEFEVIKGAAGEEFAIEYTAFIDLYKNMPNLDKIILDPNNSPIPTEPGILYAVSMGLASKMSDNNIDSICQYLERLPGEIAVTCMKDAITKKSDLTSTRGFIKFAASKTGNAILN